MTKPSLYSPTDRLLAEQFRRAQTMVVIVCRKINVRAEDYFPWVTASNVAAAAWKGDPTILTQELDVPLVVVDHVFGKKATIWISRFFLNGSVRDVAAFVRFRLRFIQAMDNQATIDRLRLELERTTVEEFGDECVHDLQTDLRRAVAARSRARTAQGKRVMADHARTAKRQEKRAAAAREKTQQLERLDRITAATDKAHRVADAEHSIRSLELVLDDPEKWCASSDCHDTNWACHDRAHFRGDTCPAFDRSEIAGSLEEARTRLARESQTLEQAHR